MSRKRQTNRQWTIAGVAVLALLAVVPTTAALRSDQASAAVAAAGDGTTAPTAGASCWGIKQQVPASASGAYWILTASMDRPAQFYCDMTTDGGGWVLLARGRNGWTFSPNGQGSPATVRTTVDGPGAFAPAALDTTTIDGLLDRANPATMADGIRLERSLNSAGTSRQQYLLQPKFRKWTWNLPAGQLLTTVTINGTRYSGSNTQDTRASVQGQTTNALSGFNDARRLFTYAWTGHGNQQGFGLGSSVTGGSSSASNHLWTQGTEGSPLPFTRVWVRPRIANDGRGFTAIPAAGFAAQLKVPSLKNRSEVAHWGVSGYNHTNEASVTPWQANVMVVKAYGNRVYVGGRFTGVQQGPGATPIPQASLAAFDLDGNWISTFRPTLAGRVWDMTMTDDGKLIVGGDFTNVNGVADTSGLVALDPISGAVNTAWKGSVTRDGGAIVRGLASRGDWIYASGRFSSVKGGTAAATGATNAVNLRSSNGQPGSWRPQVFASAVRLRVSAAGDRVYMAGFFNATNGDTNHGFYAITNPTNGAVVPNIGPYQPSEGSRVNNWYQQAVAEYGNNILVGGAEHTFQMYDHNRNTLIDSHITKNGGDFQAIEVFDGYAYASCHCMNWTYSGTNSWSNPRGFRAVDPIRMVGRWNAETLGYDTTWYPNGTKGINDEGVWSISQDSRKCLWVGGDLVRGAYSGNAATDYLGGFARFCPTDVVAPTAPTALKATTAAGAVSLSWGGSTDAGGTVSYDVYRNDRVIATTYSTSYADTTAAAGTAYRYTVRAADVRGNRSASPAPIAASGAGADVTPPSAPVVTLAAGSGSVAVSWTASTDDTAVTGYRVSRDGAVVATVGPTVRTSTDTVSTATAHTYVVTAFDAAGNTRASAAKTTTPAATGTVLLPFGSSWRWWYQAAAPTGTWQADSYPATGWQTGTGELGFGDTPKSTVITTAPAPRPLTSYYRSTVTVADPATYGSIALDLVRNAGAVVYVNGVEVARSNMPTGTITSSTYALTALPLAERHAAVRLVIPKSAFRAGSNTIAVEVHLNYKGQATAGFDLAVTGLP